MLLRCKTTTNKHVGEGAKVHVGVSGLGVGSCGCTAYHYCVYIVYASRMVNHYEPTSLIVCSLFSPKVKITWDQMILEMRGD